MAHKFKLYLLVFLLVGLNLSISFKATKNSNDENGDNKLSLCYKEQPLNDFALGYFNSQGWDIKSVTPQQDHNSEYNSFNCNLVADIKNLKSIPLKDQLVFLYDFPKPIFEDIKQNYANSLSILDNKKFFKNIKSQDFLPRPQSKKQTKLYRTSVTNENQSDLNLKAYAFLASSEPYLLTSTLGYLQYRNNQFGSLDEFKLNLEKQDSPFSFEEIEKQINQIITYTMTSLFYKFQQKTKFFVNMEFSFKFDRKTWSPVLVKLRAVNIFDQDLVTSIDKWQENKKFQFFRSYTKKVYPLISEIIDDFTYFEEVPEQLQKYTPKYLKDKYDLTLLINQVQNYAGYIQDLLQVEFEKVYQKKYWFCIRYLTQKTYPVYKWVKENKKNWIVKENTSKYSYNIQNCDIIYTQEDFTAYNKLDYNHQLWNKFQEYRFMHNKGKFYNILKDYDKKNKYNFDSNYFFPESYLLRYDRNDLTEGELKFLALDPKTDKNQWIYKPVFSSRGRGISIFDSLKDAQQEFNRKKAEVKTKTQEKQNAKDASYLLQKYIKDTQTLENRKFDIRCYLVFGWSEPGYELVLFNSGKIRRSLHDYKGFEEGEEGNDIVLSAHLTNIALSKKEYKKENDIYRNQTMSTIQQFREFLMDHESMTEQQLDDIFFEMKKILAYTAEAFLAKIDKQPGHFETYGMDIMFDENWKPFILEANASPMFNLADYSQPLKEQVFELVGSVMGLETFLVENKERAKELIKEQTQLPLGHLDLLINNANGYNILNEFRQEQTSQDEDSSSKEGKKMKKSKRTRKSASTAEELDEELILEDEYTNSCPFSDTQQNSDCERQIIIDNQNYTEFCDSNM